MFNEVDTDGDKSVTLEEWKNFWVNVLSQKGDDGKAMPLRDMDILYLPEVLGK